MEGLTGQKVPTQVKTQIPTQVTTQVTTQLPLQENVHVLEQVHGVTTSILPTQTLIPVQKTSPIEVHSPTEKPIQNVYSCLKQQEIDDNAPWYRPLFLDVAAMSPSFPYNHDSILTKIKHQDVLEHLCDHANMGYKYYFHPNQFLPSKKTFLDCDSPDVKKIVKYARTCTKKCNHGASIQSNSLTPNKLAIRIVCKCFRSVEKKLEEKASNNVQYRDQSLRYDCANNSI